MVGAHVQFSLVRTVAVSFRWLIRTRELYCAAGGCLLGFRPCGTPSHQAFPPVAYSATSTFFPIQGALGVFGDVMIHQRQVYVVVGYGLWCAKIFVFLIRNRKSAEQQQTAGSPELRTAGPLKNPG